MSFVQEEFTTPPPLPQSDTPHSSTPWKPVGPGIWELLLNGDTEHRCVLQGWEPNTTTAKEPITHTFVEEVCFLQGGLEDLWLNQAWGIGAYAYREPGMLHGPYRASGDGSLMFVKAIPVELSG